MTDLNAAAAELRRLRRVLMTKFEDLSPEDEAWMKAHPLVSEDHGENTWWPGIPKVTAWLDSLAIGEWECPDCEGVFTSRDVTPSLVVGSLAPEAAEARLSAVREECARWEKIPDPNVKRVVEGIWTALGTTR